VTVYHVEPIPRSLMAAFVAAHHYAVRVPPYCLLPLGCFRGSDLVGVASWGYGVRPRHTIQQLFASLGTGDCIWTLEDGGELRAGEGSRESHEPPRYEGSSPFRHPAPLCAESQAEDTPRQDAPGRGTEAGCCYRPLAAPVSSK